MNYEQFEQRLDRRGAVLESWPAEEAGAARKLLEHDERARRAWRSAQALHEQLDAFQPALPDLSAAIMAAIPEERPDRLLSWLFPGGFASLLRPALAGALPLLAGLAIGLSTSSAGGDDMALWEQQERLLMAPQLQDDWYE